MDEAAIEFKSGHQIRVPAYPNPCSYIRIVKPNGEELVYWDSNEWRDEPEEVMGAIMGAVMGALKSYEEKDDQLHLNQFKDKL